MDALLVAADLLDAEYDRAEQADRYLDQPVEWIVDRLGEHVWSKQAEIMNALRDHRVSPSSPHTESASPI